MHYVYKTTNKENGKYYVGVHKSENIKTDSYLGSGYILAKAIEKYGKESFEREILNENRNKEITFKLLDEVLYMHSISYGWKPVEKGVANKYFWIELLKTEIFKNRPEIFK